MIGSGIAAKSIHGAKVCVIPYPENSYRPLALRRGPLALAAALIVAAKSIALVAALVMPLPAELSTITTARIVQQTNAARTQVGLNALTVNTQLSEAAAAKAKDLIEKDYFAHISPLGVTPWFWMHQAGYTYRVAGENLAIDFVETEEVVAAWMASPTHKDNIIHTDYTETGVAVLTGEYQGGTSTVVVHMFGRPLTSSTAGTVRQTSAPEAMPAAPTATPAPTPEPTPAPVPATPAPLPQRPRTPRIAFVGSSEFVRDSLTLEITSEAGARIKVYVNDEEKLAFFAATSDPVVRTVPVDNLPDGTISVWAVAAREGLVSGESDRLAVVKDAIGPLVEKRNLAFIISPATDDPEALIVLPDEPGISARINGEAVDTSASGFGKTLLTDDLNLAFSDQAGNEVELAPISLKPQFYTDRDTTYAQPFNRLGQLARRLALVVFLIIAILLILAIMIKIRVQHPKLIVEASIVLVLAMLGMLI